MRLDGRQTRARTKEAKTSGEPGWRWRRFVIFPVIMWSFYELSLLKNSPDTMVNQTIAWGYIVLIITSVFSYTGFATVQDIVAILATRSGLPYAPESSPADPEVVAASTGTAPPEETRAG